MHRCAGVRHNPRMAFVRLLVCCPLMLGLQACAVVSVAGAAAGAVISVGGAIVSTGVKVTGKVIEKTIDAVTPNEDPPASPASD